MRRRKCFDTRLLWLLFMAFLPCLTHARDFTYNSVNYTVLDEDAKTCATKAGNGVLTDSHPVETPGTKYTGATLDLPANPVDQSGTAYKLVEISSHSFYGCGIKTVKIPNTVTVIRTSAFERCQSMAGSLVIPNSVVEIENKAFSECKEVTSITLSNSLVTIGQSAFEKITYLKGELVIPNSVVSIGKWAFRLCTNLTSISFGNSVETIGETAFQGCSKLKGSLVLPASLKSIGTNAFSQTAFTEIECNALTPPTIPNQYYAFPTTTHSTAELLVPSESLSLYKSAWEWKEFTSISAIPILPESVFINKSTVSLKEGESVILSAEVLPEEATDKTVTWTSSDESVATVRSSGFVMAVKAGETTITATTVNGLTDVCKVTVIDPDPFTYTYNDTDLTATVTGLAAWVTELRDPVISETTIHNGKTYTVTAIGAEAFKYASALKGSLTIGNSVTTIGERAFYGCTGMTGSLTIGNNVTTIGSNAFFSCKGFKGPLTIPDSVNTIEAAAFYGCSGFTGTLTIPDSVITIGQSAFSSCSGFTGSLIIPASITIIESATFSDCTGFNGTLIIPNSIKAIGGYAFYNCSGLTGALTIPDSVTIIGAGAFEGCLGFSGTLFIPELVTSIENNAFSSCSGLIGSLTIPESVTSIGSRAFNGCSGFTGSLTIGDSVKTIGEFAFSDCKGFTGLLTIPNSVTAISNYAFYRCTGLTDVKCLNPEEPTLGSDVFPTDIVIRVATGYGDAYRAARNWSTYTNLYEYGDANWSKSLTVTDAVADANYITGAPQAGKFDFECGDINMDTFITIVDATRIVDAVLKYNPSGASAAPTWRALAQTSGMLEASDFSFDADGYATVDVRYSAHRDLVAMQADLRAGEGVEIVSVEANEKVLATHSFSQSRFDDGTVRVVLFTLGNSPIATGEGEPLLRVRLRAADAQATGSLEAVRILASTPDAVETGLSYSGGCNIVASGIEDIDDESCVIVTGRDGMLRVFHAAGREVSVYDISGRLVRVFTATSDAESVELLSGVYVVRIADKTVKVIL